MMHTEAIHFDKGLELNGFGWVANIWEAQMVHEFGKDLICDAMKMWVTGTKERWPDTHFVTFGEFGELWRKQYKSNDDWNYRFVERGSGLGDSYNNLEIKWFMNKEFRLALLRDWHTKIPRLTSSTLPVMICKPMNLPIPARRNRLRIGA